jgi:hypothetical protein
MLIRSSGLPAFDRRSIISPILALSNPTVWSPLMGRSIREQRLWPWATVQEVLASLAVE